MFISRWKYYVGESGLHQDLPGCPARKSGEEWQPVAKRRHIPSWFTKAPPGRAGFFTGPRVWDNRNTLSILLKSDEWFFAGLPERSVCDRSRDGNCAARRVLNSD